MLSVCIQLNFAFQGTSVWVFRAFTMDTSLSEPTAFVTYLSDGCQLVRYPIICAGASNLPAPSAPVVALAAIPISAVLRDPSESSCLLRPLQDCLSQGVVGQRACCRYTPHTVSCSMKPVIQQHPRACSHRERSRFIPAGAVLALDTERECSSTSKKLLLLLPPSGS